MPYELLQHQQFKSSQLNYQLYGVALVFTLISLGLNRIIFINLFHLYAFDFPADLFSMTHSSDKDGFVSYFTHYWFELSQSCLADVLLTKQSLLHFHSFLKFTSYY